MKDRLTPIFIVGAFVCVVVAMMMDGGNPAVLIKPSSMVLVLGGTLCASIAGLVRSDMKNLRSIAKSALGSHVPELDTSIKVVVELARISKSQAEGGLLAADRYAQTIDDPFLRLGVSLVVDGVNSEEIRETLESEISAMEERHKRGIKFFTDMGGFSPTLGILGTVIGLIVVLKDLTSPGALGPGIASAFTATLWGVLMANLVWLPIANKLQRVSAAEVQVKEMQTEGLLAIQAGATSRMVEFRMQTFLPAGARDQVAETAMEAA